MRRLMLAAGLLAVLAVVSAAVAASGKPPAGMSPIAASLYRAQFGLCSLDTLNALAVRQGVSISALTPRVAASRLAQSRDGELGAAAVQGCRGGLLYRLNNDRVVAGLRSDLSGRITAEKYVAGVYGLVMFVFFAWVLIHAGKVARLDREARELLRLVGGPVSARRELPTNQS